MSLRLRMRPLALVGVATSVLVVAATGCARGPAPTSQGQTSTTVSPSAMPLQPNPQGYVRVEAPSTSVDCSITVELVACQRFSGVWHDVGGQVQHTVSVNASGEFRWVKADLGALRGRVPLGVNTYSAQGWTIVAQPGNTRFVNDHSGHGMTVDSERVTPF